MSDKEPIIIKEDMRGILYTSRQIAQYAGINHNRIYAARKRGEIPYPDYLFRQRSSKILAHGYTFDQMEVIVMAYRTHKYGPGRRGKIAKYIADNWPPSESQNGVGPSTSNNPPPDAAMDNPAGASFNRIGGQ